MLPLALRHKTLRHTHHITSCHTMSHLITCIVPGVLGGAASYIASHDIMSQHIISHHVTSHQTHCARCAWSREGKLPLTHHITSPNFASHDMMSPPNTSGTLYLM